jgi:hypothetical protein
MSRPIHFVGSVGGAKDVGSAMDLMLSQRDYLLWLPDGEPAERSDYVRNVIDHLPTRPGILVKRHPRRVTDWKSMRRRMIWKVAIGNVLRADDLRLGYATAAITSWKVFLEKSAEWDHPNLMFQVGLPSALTLAAVGFGIDKCLKYYPVVRQAMTREIEDILEVIPSKRVIFQIEAVIETVCSLVPQWGQRLLFPKGLGLMIVEALGQAHEHNLHAGVHFCYGSLENKAAVHPRSLVPLVRTINAVIDAWPPNCSLDYLHIPVAWSDRPPSTNQGFYKPLARLHALPPQTRLFAGVVQCNSGASSSAAERTALHLFEGAAQKATARPPGTVGVACACGTGRTEESKMAGILDRQLDLAVNI